MRSLSKNTVTLLGALLAGALAAHCGGSNNTNTTPATDSGVTPTDGSTPPPVDGGTVTIPGIPGRWTRVSAGTTYNITGIWGAAPNNIFAVAERAFLRYNGMRWSVVSEGSNEMGIATHFFGAVGGADASNVWLNGITNPPEGSGDQGVGLLWRWNGSMLAAPTMATMGRQYGRIWMASATDGWMVSSSGPLHLEGGMWVPRADGLPAGASFNAIWGSGPDSVYVVGQQLYKWDGSRWSEQTITGSNYYFGMWGSGPNDIWIVGNSAARHFTGSEWVVVRVNTQNTLRAVWGAAANDVWAVGDAGTLVHWDGTTWTAASSGLTEPLLGLWGAGAGDVWAVGERGVALHYTR